MLAALSIAGALMAQQANTDEATIEAAIKATGLNYAKSSSGLSFIVSFTVKDQPNRMVYISTKAITVGVSKWHSIYTQIWTGKEPPSAAITDTVFSSSQKLGSFYLFTDANKTHAIRFGTQFDALELPASPAADNKIVQRLKDTIYFVNAAGNTMAPKIENIKSVTFDSRLR